MYCPNITTASTDQTKYNLNSIIMMDNMNYIIISRLCYLVGGDKSYYLFFLFIYYCVFVLPEGRRPSSSYPGGGVGPQVAD